MGYSESISNQKPKQYKKQRVEHPLARRGNWKALPKGEGMQPLLTGPDGTRFSFSSLMASYFYPVSPAENWESHPSCRKDYLLPLKPFRSVFLS